MKRGVSTRSRWEIIQDILDVIVTTENRAKKTRIMKMAKMAYLDWKNFQRHFGFLIDSGFIVEIDDPSEGTVYGLTERGKELRSKLKDLELVVSV
jgi:predicted transcriptional regulator